MDVEKDEEAEPQGGWEWVKTQEEKIKKEREKVCWLSCTPQIDYVFCTHISHVINIHCLERLFGLDRETGV